MRAAGTTLTNKIDVEAGGLIVSNADSHRITGQPQDLWMTWTL